MLFFPNHTKKRRMAFFETKRDILLCLRKTWKEDSNQERQWNHLVKNFCGLIITSKKNLKHKMKHSNGRLYVAGDTKMVSDIFSKHSSKITPEISKLRFFPVRYTIVDLADGVMDDSSQISTGDVPLNVLGLGVFFPQMFDSDFDELSRVCENAQEMKRINQGITRYINSATSAYLQTEIDLDEVFIGEDFDGKTHQHSAMAFSIFYQDSKEDFSPSKLRFTLKREKSSSHPKTFEVTLHPSSMFMIPHETRNLYDYKIITPKESPQKIIYTMYTSGKFYFSFLNSHFFFSF